MRGLVFCPPNKFVCCSLPNRGQILFLLSVAIPSGGNGIIQPRVSLVLICKLRERQLEIRISITNYFCSSFPNALPLLLATLRLQDQRFGEFIASEDPLGDP